jgi:hypothetical protein
MFVDCITGLDAAALLIGYLVIFAAGGGLAFGLVCLSGYGWSIILRKFLD